LKLEGGDLVLPPKIEELGRQGSWVSAQRQEQGGGALESRDTVVLWNKYMSMELGKLFYGIQT
jgi:hypothetical protein